MLTLKLAVDQLHDGKTISNPPVEISISTQIEEKGGDVSRIKCTGGQCILARHGVSLELVNFNLDNTESKLSVGVTQQKKFKMYRGYDIRSLDFSKDYIVISGCQIFNNFNFKPDEKLEQYNDECGILVYGITGSFAGEGILGGVSDRRLGGFLFSQQGLVVIGQTKDHKDGILVATKQGELQLYNLEEPSLVVKNVNYDLSKIQLLLNRDTRIEFGNVFKKGQAKKNHTKLFLIIVIMVVLGFALLIFLKIVDVKQKQSSNKKNIYGDEIQEINTSLQEGVSFYDDDEVRYTKKGSKYD